MTNAQIAVGIGPDRERRRLDVNAVLIEESANEQDRADRDEDVFAEEESDVVHRGGVRADAIARRVATARRAILGRGFGHRRDERSHHLRMSAERREAERRGDLADDEVGEEEPARRRDADAARSPFARAP